MDKLDREIIEALRVNARVSYKDLGEGVFLSANAVSDRLRRLEEQGVIQGYEARINLRALDLPLGAVIEVKLNPGVTAAAFEAGLEGIPGIVEAMLMTGSFDYMVRVACRDQDALIRLTETLRERGGAKETHTRLLLRSVTLRTRL
jgi:Lrp/AsnC family leucine-responsive transcriptional regulator